jgi:hypothetical protein
MIRRYFRLRIKVRMDQAEALEHVTPFLFVGNNCYQTGKHEGDPLNMAVFCSCSSRWRTKCG